VADGNRAFDPQAIRFDKDSFLLEPGKKVSFVTSELDMSKASVA